MLEEKVNQIWSEEQSILAEIDSYDIKKNKLCDKFEQDIKILKTEKNRKRYQLQHFYQMSISTLFNQALETIKKNDKAPTSIEILSKFDKEELGTREYHSYFLLKKSNREIFMFPESYNGYGGWMRDSNKEQTITFEELIYDNKTNSSDIKELYKNLKKVIQEYGGNDGKETGND
jgi:hypothetical protein